jgi:ubiquinone/menaquinone biosynthesis C-methylase UbiE
MWVLQLLRRAAASLRGRFRQQRFAFFWRAVGQHAESGMWLDLGGGAGSYFLSQYGDAEGAILLDISPREIAAARRLRPTVLGIVADGERLPFKDQSIACIFCNSVLEHAAHPELLSAEIQRVGRTFFVQTPNGRFFLEPHSSIPIPFYRALSAPLRRFACRMLRASYDYVESVTYLPEEQLRALFPGRTLVYERWMGMVKSYYVIETGSPAMPASEPHS